VRPDPARAIADAVLYEGYILWPYRASAIKNQRRFTFGGAYPPAHSGRHPDDRASLTTEVLLQGAESTRAQITVRFLQVVRRDVVGADGAALEELHLAGQRYLAWEEAVEREIKSPGLELGQLEAVRRIPISVRSASDREALPESAGALVRSWHTLQGEIGVHATPVAPETWRLTVEVANRTPFDGEKREDALAMTFCSTHTLLSSEDGEFVSATDPPPDLEALAAECRNVGTWPVLVGEPGDHHTMLSSPIILEDYPRVAPESPGDLFDGGEIDQLLILNILALTDEEKAEMAASDPRAKEILERTEALGPEQLMALHGTIRERGMARPR
jgi:hypothetical protein